MTRVESETPCPECGSTSLARVRDDPAWCPACEWNLAAWPVPTVRSRRRRRTILRAREAAFAMNGALLDELTGVRPVRPTATRTRVLLTGLAGALLVVDLVLLVLGVWALVEGNVALKLLGLLAVLVGLECRPRLPRIDEAYGRLSRQEAPTLYALLDDAAAALGAPRVDLVMIDSDFNAWTGRSGLRRRVVMGIGLPLWGALTPAGRQALIGHELGHLVNGDPARGLFTQAAVTTFARLADVFDPRRVTGARLNLAHDLLSRLVAFVVLGPFHLACRWLNERTHRVAAKDHQRAEVYADALAVRLGGTDGATEVVRTLLALRPVRFAIRRAAKEGEADPRAWQAAAAESVAARSAADQRTYEQSSLRYDASLHGTHPPAGLRLRLVRSWPQTAPQIPVPVAAMAQVDAELARRYESSRRAVLNLTFD